MVTIDYMPVGFFAYYVTSLKGTHCVPFKNSSQNCKFFVVN